MVGLSWALEKLQKIIIENIASCGADTFVGMVRFS